MAIAMILYVVFIIFLIASVWIVYTKAGKPGWASIVPFYNMIVLLDMVGKPAWWLILMFIPVVNLIVLIMVYHNLSLSFGKGTGFTIGLILLGFIFFPILAFSDAKYIGPQAK